MPGETEQRIGAGITGQRGRFAPSPTGPLHFGSLVAAVASFLDARARGAEWLVRIDDLDGPRTVPGAAAAILRTLDAFCLHWDGPVIFQSERRQRYAAVVEDLLRRDNVYPCTCTRREVADSGLQGIDGLVYPGTCRGGVTKPHAPRAMRLRVDDRRIAFDDAVQGPCAQNLERAVGDFILRRADGLFAYQLAVVVDDGDAGITRVTRGADLLDSTPRQIFLQSLLGLPTPAYMHVPVALAASGDKLAKQTRARALDDTRPGTALTAALRFLGQDPPVELLHAPAQAIIAWALDNWRVDRIPRTRAATAPIEVL